MFAADDERVASAALHVQPHSTTAVIARAMAFEDRLTFTGTGLVDTKVKRNK